MGIEVSKLNNEKINEILINNYNIKALKIIKINRGTANIFKINTESGKYILKEFSEGRTKESIIKEADIIDFLNKKNIKVPKYIKSKENKFFVEYNNRMVILQEFVEGYTIQNNTGDYKKTIESATILGKITSALKEYQKLDDYGIIEKWFSQESLKKGIIKMIDLQKNLKQDNPYKEKIYKDLEEKIAISKEIENNFNFNIIKKLTIENAHGDYSVQQLIYNNDNETTVIDFETAKQIPIIWEVIRSYSYIDEEAKDGEINIDTLIEYIKEFSKYVKLNNYDLKYAAHIYLIQMISSVFGYKEYNENYEKIDLLNFAFFRTNLSKFLDKHLNEISSRLQKEILL